MLSSGLADGAAVDDVELPGTLGDVMLDVRAYYEEAGLALVDHTPAARQLESWLYRHTEADKVMVDVRQALQAAGAPQPEWVFLAPIIQGAAQ